MNVYFISEQYLTENNPMNPNTDFNLILPFIKISEDITLQQLIGTNLYSKIKNDITGNTISGMYQTLLIDYIQPIILWDTIENAMDFIDIRMMNVGLIRRNIENSSNVAATDVARLKGLVGNFSEWYQQRLIGYVVNNQASFPEYSTNSTIDKVIPTTANRYDSGIFFDRAYNQRVFPFDRPWDRDNYGEDWHIGNY